MKQRNDPLDTTEFQKDTTETDLIKAHRENDSDRMTIALLIAGMVVASMPLFALHAPSHPSPTTIPSEMGNPMPTEPKRAVI
jgi:hypothetical protein